jgi:hypothetical protein
VSSLGIERTRAAIVTQITGVVTPSTKILLPRPINPQTMLASNLLGGHDLSHAATPKRTLGSLFRSAFTLALVAGVLFGLTGGVPRAALSPKPAAIAASFQKNHDLPKGTKLSIGDPKDPVVLAYDKHGRLVLTPPEGKRFGTMLWKTLDGLRALTGQAGTAVAQAATRASE